MLLSIWLYGHRHGYDVLKVLVDGETTPTPEQVIAATQIAWEGRGYGVPEVSGREEETLEHDLDIILDGEGWKEYGFPVIKS